MSAPSGDLHELVATGGGPLDGTIVVFGRSKGVLVVDKPNRWVWLYDLNYNGDELVCRDPAGMVIDYPSLYKAAEEGHYDVLSVTS